LNIAVLFPEKRVVKMCKSHRVFDPCIVAGFLIAVCGVGCKPEAEREREATERAAASAAAEATPPIANQKAGVGVGVQGRSLEGGSESNPATLISGPAAAYFRTKEKIVFEIQIPSTLNLFVASNGRHPKSHEEYMREIIGTQIKLPKLPKGMVYRYRPDSQELWVEAEAGPGPDEPGTASGQASPEDPANAG